MVPMFGPHHSSAALGRIRRASLLLLLVAPLVTAAPSYRITDLGTMSGGDEWGRFALGINRAGQVVGYSGIAVPPPQTIVYPRAFVWQSSGGMTDLGALPGERTCMAGAIQ